MDSIWERVARAAARAQRSGALHPLATQLEHLAEGGYRFSVRVLAGPDPKRAAGREQRRTGADPFLPPYEPELFVAELGGTHVCLLNKYKVIDGHAVIATRAYAPQRELLDLADFHALGPFMQNGDALAFYNSSPEGGASQPHKHLQVLPLPGAERKGTLLAALAGRDAPALGFRYASRRLPGPGAWRRPARLVETYASALEEAGAVAAPYNLLATSEAMVVVPRTRGEAFGVPVNALGFAGSLFVPSPDLLARLKEVGPLALLRGVGVSA